MEGVKLVTADLRDAHLCNADLTGATLSTSKLEGTRLDHTTWLDGSVCTLGSVGTCNTK